MKRALEYMYGRTPKEKAMIRDLNFYGFLVSIAMLIGAAWLR